MSMEFDVEEFMNQEPDRICPQCMTIMDKLDSLDGNNYFAYNCMMCGYDDDKLDLNGSKRIC